ncbi:MAG: riboflavin synthase [Ignavibacteria bacterium]|nr:MAG: riboflavin synthase [Ignavibacteria bacterium]
MFTGIIEEVGTLRGVRTLGNGRRFDIQASAALQEVAEGDSIAVNGVCLTVVEFTERSFAVEAVEETMKKSTLGTLAAGSRVNLERALRANGKLGGHFVQGHVDFTAEIRGIQRREESWIVEVAFPESASANIIPVGSISIDGVSLTVAEKLAGSFRVSVIPHTWEHTLFAQYHKGTRVNIELDMIGKYVLNYLQASTGKGMSEGFLKGLGY